MLIVNYNNKVKEWSCVLYASFYYDIFCLVIFCVLMYFIYTRGKNNCLNKTHLKFKANK